MGVFRMILVFLVQYISYSSLGIYKYFRLTAVVANYLMLPSVVRTHPDEKVPERKGV